MSKHEDWIEQAYSMAESNGDGPEDALFGALIVKDGKVLAEAVNITDKKSDPTAHAEVEAIRAACNKVGSTELKGATLYSTLQPCGMCTMAAIWSGIRHIVFGAQRGDVHDMYFEGEAHALPDYLADAKASVEWQGGVLADKCATLYFPPDADIPDADQPVK